MERAEMLILEKSAENSIFDLGRKKSKENNGPCSRLFRRESDIFRIKRSLIP
jgi:hypothetical protein